MFQVGAMSEASRHSVYLLGGTLACALLETVTGCGQVADAPVPIASGATTSSGTGGTGPSTMNTGGGATGGQPLGTGGTGGASGASTVPKACSNKGYPGLEPPCGASDLHGTIFECGSDSHMTFNVPLDTVKAPANDLGVVVFRLDADGGLGGMGGSNRQVEDALELFVSAVYPSWSGELSGGRFSLTAPAEHASADHSYDTLAGLPMQYFHHSGLPDIFDNVWYAEAHVGLVQGDTVVAEYRLLVDDTSVCLR